MMLCYVTVKSVISQTALEGQDLPRTYLAHHEPAGIIIIIVM